MSASRPILRYHGGKWMLAPWIIRNFPEHRVYVEPFGGAGSVLLRKRRCFCEVWNDLDGEVVNLFRVARDHGSELREKLAKTPFARDEFILSYKPSDDPIETARRTVVRSFMGFGSNSVSLEQKTEGVPATGFRGNSARSGTAPCHDWAHLPDSYDDLIKRLRGVVIENRDACKVMAQHDAPGTLHYLDPPYVFETRKDTHADYRHEMTDDQHRKLAEFVRELQGMVVLSGYRSSLYDELYNGFHCLEKSARADGGAARVECLWLSPNCVKDQIQPELF